MYVSLKVRYDYGDIDDLNHVIQQIGLIRHHTGQLSHLQIEFQTHNTLKTIPNTAFIGMRRIISFANSIREYDPVVVHIKAYGILNLMDLHVMCEVFKIRYEYQKEEDPTYCFDDNTVLIVDPSLVDGFFESAALFSDNGDSSPKAQLVDSINLAAEEYKTKMLTDFELLGIDYNKPQVIFIKSLFSNFPNLINGE